MTIQELAVKRNKAKKAVQEWMAAEGAKGKLRTNGSCPFWLEYERAEAELDCATAAVS